MTTWRSLSHRLEYIRKSSPSSAEETTPSSRSCEGLLRMGGSIVFVLKIDDELETGFLALEMTRPAPDA